MGGFFHGWRRKAGCAFLVIAIPLASAWMRSASTDDAVRFTVFGRRHLIRSERNGLSWCGWDEKDDDFRMPNWASQPHWQPEDLKIAPGVLSGSFLRGFPHPDYLFGILFERESRRGCEWKIAHWILVWPLTLLSAYLILWKPRQASKPVASGIVNSN